MQCSVSLSSQRFPRHRLLPCFSFRRHAIYRYPRSNPVMPRYCPMCGKSDAQAQFTGEFCHSCAKTRLEDFAPVRITICSKCGAIIDKARKKKDAKLGEEVIRLLKLKQKDAEFDEKNSQVTYDSSM